MSSLPEQFRDLDEACNQGWALVRETKGYLSEREARCVMIAAALSPAQGANVEIGSFQGRSTVGIAHILRRYQLGRLTAVDPHTAPSLTNIALKGVSTLADFTRNLERAGVSEVVDPQVMYSQDLARDWKQPIRFLWIDGDHTYDAAKADLHMFKPFLVPGALVLMHDVLGTHYGSLRTFTEEILGSNDFGAAGFCGSIGWAQYRPSDGHRLRYRFRRKLLAIPASQIMPVAKSPRGLAGWNKLRYKVWRPLAPHGNMKARTLWSKISAP